ncbi:lipid A deacylase LpxR family protein [Polaribacter uvawellassae]|uniref:lipid A deacylase LpxR family protein n=1 Tax=Polaribacter uvawellassae TaxID=3133495 RepID=UPI00321C2063
MRIIAFLFFICFPFFSVAQSTYSKEFSLISDNDLYTSIHRDGYYTNGLFLTYRTVKNEVIENSPKRIYKFEVGQMMFTASKSTLPFASLHDRPFAGYFYASFGISRFYKSNNVFTTDIEIGALGPNAKGEELQTFMHDVYNYPRPLGWKHQIQNAIAINFNSSFVYYFNKVSSKKLDFSSFNTLKVGTIFTSISSGIYSRFGFKTLQPFSNSVAFHSNLNTTSQSNSESFIFAKPMLNYSLYDATIEGSFLNKTSSVTFDVMPFHFSLEVGYRYYRKRFLYGYTYIYHTKKLKSLRASKSNSYGSIYIGYYFN